MLALSLPILGADEIHWTFTGQTSVAFDWRGAETTLSYGTSSGVYTNTVTAIAPTPLPTSSSGPFREATLTGLSENTLYYYKIGSGAEHTFRTPPPRGSSGFTIYVQGDVGSTHAYSRVSPVQKIVAGVYGNGLAPFVLVPGDLTYGDSNGLDDVDQHFNDVMIWSQDAAYMPCWGNHEWQGGSFNDFINNYEGRFAFPNSQTSPGASSAQGNGPGEDWYWFDYGNTRFVAYPEPYSGAWSDWSTKAKTVMDAAQADPLIAHIVTFGHRPAYSSGSTSGNTTLQPILDSLGDGHSKYRLDLSGHAHHYERTLAQHGVVHVVVGTGHVSPGTFGNTQPVWSAFRTIQSGALKLRFWASGIEGQFHCAPASSVCYADGGVLDDFTIGTPGDTTPPSVSITAPAANATVSGTVTVSANASDNSGQVASVQFKLDGQNLGAADTTAPFSVSWNTISVANGAHTLTAQALDPDGNGATSAPISVTVSNASSDTTPPSVSMTAPAANATVSGSVTVSANATDNSGQVASVQFKLDGQNLGAPDATAPYSISWNTTPVANGVHTLSAEATDLAGNVGTSAPISVTVSNASSDTTPPTVAVTSPAANATVSGTVTVAAAASDDSGQVVSVQFKLDGQNLGAPDTAAPYSISWNTTAVGNGAHILSAQATDPAGNSATASIAVTVNNDSTAPSVSVTAPAADAFITGTVTVQASASDSGGVASVQFKLDGQNLGAPDTTAPYSISWNTTTASIGLHTLSAQATDTAGNSATSAAVTVTVDRTAPAVSFTSPAPGATLTFTVPVEATASDTVGQVAGVQFKLDGQNLGAEDTTAPYSISWDTTAVLNGTHTLSATARDTVSNSSTVSIIVTVSNPILTFTASADATIKPSSPSSNSGSSTTIGVDAAPAKQAKEFLVKFTVAGLAGRPVVAVKLRLYNTGGSDKGGDFYRVADSSWTEKGVTWSNAPLGDPAPIASLGAVASSQWVDVNVTPLVTGDGTYSLRVKTTSNDSADYSSREVAGKAPQLIVTYMP